jgi:hypothetical protein
MSRIDPVLRLLAGLIVFFTFVLIACDYGFKSEGQVFQVFSGVLTGLMGAFLARIKPPAHDEVPPPGTSQTTIQATTAAAVSDNH